LYVTKLGKVSSQPAHAFSQQLIVMRDEGFCFLRKIESAKRAAALHVGKPMSFFPPLVARRAADVRKLVSHMINQ